MRIASDLARFNEAQAELSRFLADRGVAGRAGYAAELVFDEIVPNIIRHGYGAGGDRFIDVRVDVTPAHVVLAFEDDAPAFDPNETAAPAPATSLDDVRIGGLGLVLVKDFAESVEYERVDGRNRLTVRVGRD